MHTGFLDAVAGLDLGLTRNDRRAEDDFGELGADLRVSMGVVLPPPVMLRGVCDLKTSGEVGATPLPPLDCEARLMVRGPRVTDANSQLESFYTLVQKWYSYITCHCSRVALSTLKHKILTTYRDMQKNFSSY